MKLSNLEKVKALSAELCDLREIHDHLRTKPNYNVGLKFEYDNTIAPQPAPAPVSPAAPAAPCEPTYHPFNPMLKSGRVNGLMRDMLRDAELEIIKDLNELGVEV